MALFEKIAIIGIGLIGSSIARVVRERGIANTIAISTRSQETLDAARDLNLGGRIRYRCQQNRRECRPGNIVHAHWRCRHGHQINCK